MRTRRVQVQHPAKINRPGLFGKVALGGGSAETPIWGSVKLCELQAHAGEDRRTGLRFNEGKLSIHLCSVSCSVAGLQPIFVETGKAASTPLANEETIVLIT